MDNIKITASFTLQGRVLPEEKDCLKDPKMNKVSFIKVYDKAKNEFEKVSFKTRKAKPCSQSINMTEDTYKYMIETPADTTPSHWKRISDEQKIVEHLKLIQKDLNAYSFTYTIYED